jgi:hypothetical protein
MRQPYGYFRRVTTVPRRGNKSNPHHTFRTERWLLTSTRHAVNPPEGQAESRNSSISCKMNMMSSRESFNVETPLERQWVDSPEEVCEVIDRYMRTEGANLLRVVVSRMRQGQRTGNGEVLAPQEFWKPED